MTTAVISKDGTVLMPTTNIKKVRKLLKEGNAHIIGLDPFAIRLHYDPEGKTVQPVELSMDTGYLHIGISVKSEKYEFISEERKLLPDEKAHHQMQKRYRQSRRNRGRYRKPLNKRASHSKHKEKGRIAPSLKHKADAHIDIIKKYTGVFPITDITLEMGQFDTQVLAAINEGKPVPEGLDYQHGPKYGYDTLREAVFSRDKHTCQVCKKSAIKDGRILVTHHIGFRRKDRSDRLGNLLTLSTKCHTPKNHKPDGKLWDITPKTDNLSSAAYMNTVKWLIYDTVKTFGIRLHITYGAVTKRERLSRNIQKSHANDAYCIGQFHPKHRTLTAYYKKRRRNDRCLEHFHDAKYRDIRDGKIKKASELGCNRTKRNVPRRNPNNERHFRGEKISSGYRRIRKEYYPFKPGDLVLYEGKPYICGGQRNKGNSVVLKNYYPDGREKSPAPSKVRLLHHAGGWIKTTETDFYKKGKS